MHSIKATETYWMLLLIGRRLRLKAHVCTEKCNGLLEENARLYDEARTEAIAAKQLAVLGTATCSVAAPN